MLPCRPHTVTTDSNTMVIQYSILIETHHRRWWIMMSMVSSSSLFGW